MALAQSSAAVTTSGQVSGSTQSATSQRRMHQPARTAMGMASASLALLGGLPLPSRAPAPEDASASLWDGMGWDGEPLVTALPDALLTSALGALPVAFPRVLLRHLSTRSRVALRRASICSRVSPCLP